MGLLLQGMVMALPLREMWRALLLQGMGMALQLQEMRMALLAAQDWALALQKQVTGMGQLLLG
jgi:hypothetical protein